MVLEGDFLRWLWFLLVTHLSCLQLRIRITSHNFSLFCGPCGIVIHRKEGSFSGFFPKVTKIIRESSTLWDLVISEKNSFSISSHWRLHFNTTFGRTQTLSSICSWHVKKEKEWVVVLHFFDRVFHYKAWANVFHFNLIHIHRQFESFIMVSDLRWEYWERFLMNETILFLMTKWLLAAHRVTDYSSKYLQREPNISSQSPRDSLGCI